VRGCDRAGGQAGRGVSPGRRERRLRVDAAGHRGPDREDDEQGGVPRPERAPLARHQRGAETEELDSGAGGAREGGRREETEEAGAPDGEAEARVQGRGVRQDQVGAAGEGRGRGDAGAAGVVQRQEEAGGEEGGAEEAAQAMVGRVDLGE
jgi:hypothetical protein